MKIHKKMVVVLALLVAGLSFGLLTARSQAASSTCATYKVDYEACSSAEITKADGTYKFTDMATITARFGGQTVTFTDKEELDGTHEYLAEEGTFCSGVGKRGGITITNWSQVESGATKVEAQVDIDYWGPEGGPSLDCRNWNGNGHKVTVANPGKAATDAFHWEGDQIAANDGSMSLVNISSNFFLYGEDSVANCAGAGFRGGGFIILLTTKNGNTGNLYELAESIGSDANDTKELAGYFKNDQCRLAKNHGKVTITGRVGTTPGDTTDSTTGGTSPVDTGGSCDSGPGCDTATGTCTDAAKGCEATTAAAENECEERSVGFSLRWLFCPMLASANWVADRLTGLFEQQLSFTLADQQNEGQANSSVSDDGLQGLRQAWSVIRLLASSLIIILMLVMIISEAMGGGPFDAYTVRKVLPKLIIAVILIQISWSIFVWVINAVDDLGHSLANILYQPFGGRQNMNLTELFNHAGIGAREAGGTLWIGLIGIIIATTVAAPFILILCFGAILALLTAVIVMMFRKVIIIMALIFAPLALLAWVLPGTQRYWKLWSDNLMKALFMFPLVVAIVAVGRIFAWTAGTTGNGTLINFLIVFVGFFGPLFILPKAYKWGGGLMNATGNLTSKGVQGAAKPATDWMKWNKDTSKWAMSRKNRRAVKEQLRGRALADSLGRPGVRGAIAKGRLLGLGTPKGEKDVISRVGRLAKAQSAKAEEEDIGGYFQALGAEVDGLASTDTVDASGNTVKGATSVLTDKLAKTKKEDVQERKAILKKMAQYKGAGVTALKGARTSIGAEDWGTYANSGYLYDDFKGLDANLLHAGAGVPGAGTDGGFYDNSDTLQVGDEILSGMTEAGWRDFHAEAGARGKGHEALEAFDRIVASPAATRLDAKGRGFMEGLSASGTVPVRPVAAAAAPAAPPTIAPGAIAGASDFDIHAQVVNPSGGWRAVPDPHLVEIYNSRSGSVKQQAENELRRRGKIS